jgi:hypothetical protein
MKMRASGFVCGLVLLLASQMASAEEAGDDGWHFLVAPYLWVASLDGETGAKGTTSNLHWSFEDIVQHLDMGFMGQLEAHKGQLGFVVSPVYFSLSTEENGPVSFIDVRPGLDAEVVEAFATWEYVPGFELLAGARYINIDLTLRLHDDTSGATVSKEAKKNWTDPIVGARYFHDFDEHWSMGLRGDVGGSGSKSDFVWNALATVHYKFDDSGTLYLGYRVLDYDYQDGNPANRFTFNIRIDGPVIGYGMTF